jgi:hypothetical protein
MKTKRTLLVFLLQAVIGLSLFSCASPGVRGQPPFIQVNGLKVVGELINLDLGLRNVNTEILLIDQIEFSISLNEVSLAIYNAPSQANVIANGTEKLSFELNPSTEGLALLNELQNDDHPNLEYLIEGVLTITENGEMKIKRKGNIYKVPGRPGQFR